MIDEEFLRKMTETAKQLLIRDKSLAPVIFFFEDDTLNLAALPPDKRLWIPVMNALQKLKGFDRYILITEAYHAIENIQNPQRQKYNSVSEMPNSREIIMVLLCTRISSYPVIVPFSKDTEGNIIFTEIPKEQEYPKETKRTFNRFNIFNQVEVGINESN